MSHTSTPKIVVTGDVIREVHVYQGTRPYPWNESPRGTRVKEEWGGANLLQDILEESQPGISALGVEIDRSADWPAHLTAYALYSETAHGFKNDPASGEKPK